MAMTREHSPVERPAGHRSGGQQVRAALAAKQADRTAAALMRIAPSAVYFPDFLTPGRGTAELETGLDLVAATPKRRPAEELGRMFTGGPGEAPVPAGVRRLAVAVEPYLPAIRAAMAADRPVRAEAALEAGPDGLLESYQPQLMWRHGVLESSYPVDRELKLRGRSLTLIPSFFCVRRPVALADEELPPVLVHPLAPEPGWLERSAADPAELPVGQLIGVTRAHVLEALEHPRTTGQLAAALRVTLSTASRHATVLREAGLVASARRGNSVVHIRKKLGDALMNGVL
ncbi:winged helix-turn-helix domain-containing protein [Streptomyces sp. A3M-1-3]|uniref:ArsR/SmtB family transcription factor n=1 Tax=Streptomyces sp. A3M-1-3 TaxID=2962044 RepID=UPI0020B63CCD|nr:winged helix-turn-helix domain-containing protein [Streptomyces sp. A3M-1-3]MCP3817598.1 winged helix-turn-helix domain-containing protein [Streptomyces sp. A3M-1-3]